MNNDKFPLIGFICPIHQTKLKLVSTTKGGFVFKCKKCNAAALHDSEIFISHKIYKHVTWMNISL